MDRLFACPYLEQFVDVWKFSNTWAAVRFVGPRDQLLRILAPDQNFNWSNYSSSKALPGLESGTRRNGRR
jgi:hypothetical protein